MQQGARDAVSKLGVGFGLGFAVAVHVVALAAIGFVSMSSSGLTDQQLNLAMFLFGVIVPIGSIAVAQPVATRVRRVSFLEAVVLALITEGAAIAAYHVLFGGLYVYGIVVVPTQFVVAGFTGAVVNMVLGDPVLGDPVSESRSA